MKLTTSATPQVGATVETTREMIKERLLATKYGILNPADHWLSCDYCDFSTIRKAELILHMYYHTAPSEEALFKPFCCEYCGKRFVNKSVMASHLLVHTGEKPFRCTFPSCDRTFARVSSVKAHLRFHTREKPFKCSECHKVFATNVQRQSHRKSMHSDVRAYSCEQCDRSFKVHSTLAEHRRIHDAVPKFNCNECGRSFRQANAYRMHMNLHTGNRPYKCRTCELSFSSTATRLSHEKSKHLPDK